MAFMSFYINENLSLGEGFENMTSTGVIMRHRCMKSVTAHAHNLGIGGVMRAAWPVPLTPYCCTRFFFLFISLAGDGGIFASSSIIM